MNAPRGSSLERAGTAVLAAQLLTEAGSALQRARDLLELMGWRADDVPALAGALSAAVRQANTARNLIDARVGELRATLAADLEQIDAFAAEALELRGQLEQEGGRR